MFFNCANRDRSEPREAGARTILVLRLRKCRMTAVMSEIKRDMHVDINADECGRMPCVAAAIAARVGLRLAVGLVWSARFRRRAARVRSWA